MANLESLDDLDKIITEIHCDKISRNIGLQWRRLPAYVGLESETLINDIDKLSIGEEDKRGKFLSKWKERKGSDVTYKNLIEALVEMGCRNDAEHVKELVRPVTSHVSVLNIQGPTGML